MTNSIDPEAPAQMPEAEDGFIKTLNNTGYMTVDLDRYSRAFVDASGHEQLPVMDIGAAYGVATLQALQSGANVIANDIEEKHLQVLYHRVPDADRCRLRLLCGPFPDLDIEADSLGAALICRVLHFFDGETIERAANNLNRWIRPGGKVFVISETPFVGTLKAFASEYARRKEEGDSWPGLIIDMQAYTARAGALPKLGNWLDVDVLTLVFSGAGFIVEHCDYFARPEFPQWLQLDGRESVGLIGRKR